MMEEKELPNAKTAGCIIGMLIWGVVFLVLFGIVGLLYNATIPELFGAKPIGFWQAGALYALCRILFATGSRRRNARKA